MDISVIICTYNRDKYIYNVLKSVAENDFPKSSYEIILVDNNSTDRTALGDVLIYVDDDATVNCNYLSAYSAIFSSHPEIYAAGGPIIPGNYYPGGGNAAYRKTVFEKIGIYNTELGRKGSSLAGGEEKDIFDKMTSAGMKFIYTPNAVLYHIIPHYKLENDYLKRVSFGIGTSEKARTLAISKQKYCRRLMEEMVKWGGTLVLWIYHLIRLKQTSGNKLVLFRYNVTRGLLNK